MRIDKTICDSCTQEINEVRSFLGVFPSLGSERKGLGIQLKIGDTLGYRDFCHEKCLRDFLNKHFPPINISETETNEPSLESPSR